LPDNREPDGASTAAFVQVASRHSKRYCRITKVIAQPFAGESPQVCNGGRSPTMICGLADPLLINTASDSSMQVGSGLKAQPDAADRESAVRVRWA
jgi:hypothetical protein